MPYPRGHGLTIQHRLSHKELGRETTNELASTVVHHQQNMVDIPAIRSGILSIFIWKGTVAWRVSTYIYRRILDFFAIGFFASISRHTNTR